MKKRSGGKTLLTFLYDNGLKWLLELGAAFLLTHFTDLPILPVFACVLATSLLKSAVGIVLVSKRLWVNNLVEKM